MHEAPRHPYHYDNQKTPHNDNDRVFLQTDFVTDRFKKKINNLNFRRKS